MRFPSIDALAVRSRDVLLRFPWVMAAGVVAAFAAINAVRGPSMDYWARLAMVAALGLPLLTALTLFVEQRGWTGIGRTALLAGGVLLLAGFYQVWPGPEETYQAIRYFQLSAALHLLVAFLPFLGRFQRDVFWQYNRRLFEAILRAVLFSGVLFLGLVIALAALDKLFGVDVPGETYARLWFVMALVANTWIFLGGVPDDLPALANDTDYPKGLKVLSQYILTPLVTIYLVLLTAYILKILITGDWPSGWIGYLVASVAVVGLLAFLLVAPLRDREGEGWIRTFSRWLFIGLMPAAVMFLLALWKRIDPYGLTELRVLGFVMGLWLLGIALWYTVRRNAGIHLIPISLAILLLATLYGPTSTTSLSVASQSRRIRFLLTTGADSTLISTTAQVEISSALRFLLQHNAGDAIQDALGSKVSGLAGLPPLDDVNRDSVAAAILDSLHLEYTPTYHNQQAGYFSYSSGEFPPLEIRNYDYTFPITQQDTTPVVLDGDSLTIRLDSTEAMLRVLRHGEPVLAFDLSTVVDSLKRPDNPGKATARRMRAAAEANGMRGMLQISYLNGRRTNTGVRITDVSGQVFLGYSTPPVTAPGKP
ncbi:MAG TPA: DUF4153 domain-containing protein [Gemmatimonadales bacterium]|nr:DUF4153 domain-containing protein [Gemmatimonadales bacterium]